MGRSLNTPGIGSGWTIWRAPMISRRQLLKVSLTVCGCATCSELGIGASAHSAPADSPTAIKATGYDLWFIGSQRETIMNGKLAAVLDLKTLAGRRHLYGIGPIEQLRGEVTIADSRPALARVASDGTVKVTQSLETGVPFFVWAEVSQWYQKPIPPNVRSFEALERFVPKAAAAAGLDADKPFPFLVSGHEELIVFHIVNRIGDGPHNMEMHRSRSPSSWKRLKQRLSAFTQSSTVASSRQTTVTFTSIFRRPTTHNPDTSRSSNWARTRFLVYPRQAPENEMAYTACGTPRVKQSTPKANLNVSACAPHLTEANSPFRTTSMIEEAPEHPRSARVLQLAQRLGLDLADALSRDRELLADLFQRLIGVHPDAEAHAQHALLARGERGEHPRCRLAQVRLDGGVDRRHRVLVLDEVAEVRILLVADRGFQGNGLLGDLQNLAHLLERHAELLGQLLGRRLAADLVQHLTRRADDFVDRLDHVHRDADGARLVGDRAGDRLADPPRGVGRELVAAPVFELVHRLHQADVAFLDQVEELQAAVGVFLGDRDDEAQVGLDHFLLGLARLALALLHHLDDLAEFQDLEPGLARQRVDVRADLLDPVLVLGDEVLPPLGRELRRAVEPARVKLGALVVLQKILARDAVAFGKPHQPALVAHQALVDVVELLDQRIDARLVEPQRLHLGDDLFLELLVFALLRGRERGALELELDVLVLQPAQALVFACDLVEGLEHLGLEFGLDRGQRQRALHIVVVEVGFRRALGLVLAILVGGAGTRRHFERGRTRGRGRGRRHLRRLAVAVRCGIAGNHDRLTVGADRRRHPLGVGARIGRLEIDDVAQEHLALVELVAPDNDGLEGERALAQARDHGLAAGLDALGDRDLALARQQLDRPDLAQIPAHWIVDTLGRRLS